MIPNLAYGEVFWLPNTTPRSTIPCFVTSRRRIEILYAHKAFCLMFLFMTLQDLTSLKLRIVISKDSLTRNYS
jgi:hypothetical protein